MRYTIAAFAALASLAAAVPGYGYGEQPAAVTSKAPEYPAYPVETPEVSSKAPEYPAYPVETPEVSSKAPEYPAYPVETPKVSSKVPEYPSYPESSKTPEYEHSKPSKPEETESCLSSTTITVTVPYPTGTGYPHGPKPTETPYYPIVPSGTGYVPHPTGYKPSSTGGYTKPSTPAEFTGAASSLNAAGFVAGVGAFAAFFL